ncbi:hypothetical protein CYG48_05060 [Neorhizobium sp. SOG26]|uniref:hypothetical protein n=1 Tax=Neorhizobium sp. SOG26 TaxID=2060726 RepID=UPI000E56DE8F|nr:hypothetical protein [Neorhizobium sp. SOG26]AXV15123.1 hypothetical protein CYG48_05060 [Neorhizobium sp. SOG26]
MVQIATSRDINRQSTRSGRIAPNAPQGGIGAALANAGQDMVQVAYDLNDLRTQEDEETRRKAGYDLETKIAQFRDQEEQAFLKAREGTTESGIGFTRQFIEGYETRVNDFIKNNFTGVSDAQDAQSRQTLLGLGNSLYGKAYSYEQQAKANFYDRTTNTGLDTIRTQIRNNAAPYEELKRQGLAAIDAADMPEPWKAERRALWDADAAESKWRWKFEQDPQGAIQDVKGGGSSLVDKIVGVESGGNATAKNPNSSATGAGQFISSTWMNMIKQYRPDLAQGRSTQEVLALRNDPTISREMTQRYAEENATFLRNQGIATTDGNVYLAHFLGPRGAAQILKADPATPVENIVGRDAVNANGFLRGKTAADLQAWADKKMGGAGVTSAVSRDTTFDAIPYERREKLAAWAETEYSQQVNRERAAAKDRYSLLIATQPDQVDEKVILRDQTIDNGDKAQLINSLNAAKKESAGVNELISAMSQGNVSINPFDADQRKLGNKAYEKMLGAAAPDQQATLTSDFVARTGYIPEKVQAELRRGASSTDASQMAQAMEAASVLQKNAPVSFGAFDGSAAVSKNLDLYKTYTQTMGYSPDEAARKIISGNDPEQIRRRDAILKSEPVKKLLKDKSADDVAAIFDKGFFSAAPDVGGTATPTQIQVGVNPEAEAAIVADYRSVLEEALVDANGDQGAAEDIAKRRFQTIYGTTQFSSLSSNIVVRYPPEKAYPAMPDGSHDYVREQLAEAMKAEGVEADAFYLQGDGDTEKDIRAGKPARYQVFYEKDGKLQRFNLPFYADVDAAKASFKAKQEQTLREAEQRMLENRVQQERTFPEGEGAGRLERFSNDKLYRGMARENSPLGKALEKSRQAQDRAAKARAEDDAERRAFDELTPEEQRERSMDSFLNGPFQPQGMR